MTADIIDEIARRLNVAADDVAPVLESVVERIRQQVEHYGYARLANLGTFRGDDGHIVFEPDAALAETINARFTGLEEILIEEAAVDELKREGLDEDDLAAAAADTEPEPAEDEPTEGLGEAPFYDADDAADAEDEPAGAAEEPSEPFEAAAEEEPLEPERSVQPSMEGTDVPEHDLEGTAIPEHESQSDLEGTAVPEHESQGDVEGTFLPESEHAADDWDGVEEPAPAEREPPEATDAPSIHERDVPDEEDDDAPHFDESDAYWDEREQPSEDHPLGPESEPPYEEADFAVLGERDEDADDAENRNEPTISWEPLGAAGAEAAAGRNEGDLDDELGDEEDAFDATWPSGEPIEDDSFAAEDIEEPAEADAAADKRTAPDPNARPHESSEPARTIRPPTRRSHRERDMKPIWLGVGIIVLVAAAAVAYFTLPDTPVGPAEEEVAQTEPIAPPDTAAAEAAADTVTAEELPPPPPASTPLRSEESIDPAAGGYTIVVHSETSESPAEEVAAQYRTDGYRTGVLSAQQGGVTRYRVGVGQFETLDEATQQRNELAGGDLPADAWVLRINQ